MNFIVYVYFIMFMWENINGVLALGWLLFGREYLYFFSFYLKLGLRVGVVG